MVLVPARLFRVLLFAVGFQRGIDFLSQRLHLTRVRQAFGVWNSRRCVVMFWSRNCTILLQHTLKVYAVQTEQCSRSRKTVNGTEQVSSKYRTVLSKKWFSIPNTNPPSIWYSGRGFWEALIGKIKAVSFSSLYKVKGTEERYVLGEWAMRWPLLH